MYGQNIMRLVIIFTTFTITEELTSNSDKLSITSCQGNDQLLMWNFTKEENERIKELHWFLNETTLICIYSMTDGFHVTALYTDRVDQKGDMGILLKNVSFNDTGEYTLYVKLDEETVSNVQGISLTVVEQMQDHCRPIIETHSKSNISCSTSCERLTLSTEWTINGTGNPVGIGPYFVLNSSWTSERLFCCLRDLKCHYKLCSLNHVSFAEDINHEDNQSEMCPPVKVTNCECTETREILLICMGLTLLVIISTGLFLLRDRKSITHFQGRTVRTLAANTCEELELIEATDSNTADQYKENFQQVVHTVATNTDSNATDQYKKNNQQVVHTVATNTDSNSAGEYKENPQQVVNVVATTTDSNWSEQYQENFQQVVHAVATTTARPLEDSNQHVKIMKHSIMVPESLKYVPYTGIHFTVDLTASKKESRTLKHKGRTYNHLNQTRKRRKLSQECIKTTRMKWNNPNYYDAYNIGIAT